MNSSSRSSSLSSYRQFIIILSLTAAGLTGGCGSNTMRPPKLQGNTSVAVALTSTANNQLSQFILDFQTLTLTSQSGKTVDLLAAPQPSELIHLNGGIAPFTTATVPQDVYTSATATIGGALFACITILPPGSVSPGGIGISMYAYGHTPDSNVTVTLPAPITITGESMALSLDLLVSQSASYPSSCYTPGIASFSITPTFNLTPTNPRNGKVAQLKGQITAIGTAGNTLTLSLPEPNSRNTRTMSVVSTGSTIYDGISNFSALAVGMLVDMDGAIQSEGSLQATRIAVEDPLAVDVMIGPVLFVSPYQPAIAEPSAQVFSRLSQGKDSIPDSWGYGTESALFQASGEINNLQSLPFVASFNGSNMVAGQNVYVTSQNMTYSGGIYTVANTVTLMPQTINGTIVASSQVGNFTDYTVSLAPYDLFPTLAVQPGQTTLLTNPSQMEVYVDNNTQNLNTMALTPGNTLRFYGLVFNDNGTLRMDCAQVNDGVTESSQQTSASRLATEVRTISGKGPGGQIITVVTRQ